jgi:hypothetical protein
MSARIKKSKDNGGITMTPQQINPLWIQCCASRQTWQKLLPSIALVFGCFIQAKTFAQVPVSEPGWGAGVIVGHPATGISGKTRLNQREGFAYAAAWRCLCKDDYEVHLHADYLLHDYNLFQNSPLQGQVAGYFGIGLRGLYVKDDDNEIDLRLPLGILFEPVQAPLDVFVEIVPMVDIFPETGLSLHAALGARFFP